MPAPSRPVADAPDRPLEDFVGRFDLARWRSRPGRWLASGVLAASRWTTATWLIVAHTLLAGIVVGLCGWGAGELYESVADSEGISLLDRPLLDWIESWRTPWLNDAVTAFTHLGGPIGGPVVAAVILGGLALAWRSWWPIILGVVAGGGALVIGLLGKLAVGRLRPPYADAVPPYETSTSFPSGHTITSFALAGIVAYLVLTHIDSRRGEALTIAVAFVYALAMGLSRVYLGHHWLTDVLTGWALGAAWLAAVITAHRLWLTWRRARADEVPEELAR